MQNSIDYVPHEYQRRFFRNHTAKYRVAYGRRYIKRTPNKGIQGHSIQLITIDKAREENIDASNSN